MAVGLKDFSMVKYLASGSFARVFLVRKVGGRDDGTLYAMKRVPKGSSRKAKRVRMERDVLDYIRYFPYVTNMHYAFGTEAAVYLVTDFVRGGDLSRLLHERKFLEERDVRMYVAELVLALTGLHRVGIVHRDLKERNILLDSNGHVVVADFGFSKFLNLSEKEKTYSFCGTLEYMAPEVINHTLGMDQAVDWWALGVVTCKLLGGLSPFCVETETTLGKPSLSKSPPFYLRRILHGQPTFPPAASLEARDFMQALLTKDPEKRLGSRGVDEIKAHPFFRGLSWDEVMAKTNRVPLIPEVLSDQELTESHKRVPLKECDVTAPPEDNIFYEGFTYVAASILLSEITDEEDLSMTSD
ncbi:ribosomal protein S6 kinase alpha-4-like [Pomacea canaliculata]|uniref:ribosomal protein S6 kinase alpha-4-like n=1 Tax=Pomacea canaliculata TaxID=400727 RepID=UPI000D72B93F|nr:ribosomal protein S6 kinase alpha-4-like [Pomacea canaliculata]